MSHDRHEGQPGYSPQQILHDHCRECEYRGDAVWPAINYLDMAAFANAWIRAVQYGRGELADVSAAEVALLRTLWAIQVQFERRGVPIGSLPLPAGVEA